MSHSAPGHECPVGMSPHRPGRSVAALPDSPVSPESGYVHGYSSAERDRLIHQAATLEPFLHRNLAFNAGSNVLEIGCGVGAQLHVLASRHPRCRFWGVDIAEEHVAAARRHLRDEIASGRVWVATGDGSS